MLRLSKQDFKTNIRLFFVCLLMLFSDVFSQKTTDGMIFIEGAKFHYVQQNRMREGLELKPFQEGPIGDAYIDDYWVDLEDFYIDKYEVTNRQFKKFIDATGYKPKWPKNFQTLEK